MKRCCVFLLIILLSFTGCTVSSYTMEQEVQLWNEASERTKARYNSVKELSSKHWESLEKAYLRNEYSEDLVDLYTPTEELNTSEGYPNYNFFELLLKDPTTKDSYDSYLYLFADTKKIIRTDLFTHIDNYFEQYGYLSAEEMQKLDLAPEENFNDFLFYKPNIIMHKFFTGLNSPSVTEIIKYEGYGGAYITVKVTWLDNKIIDVERSV